MADSLMEANTPHGRLFLALQHIRGHCVSDDEASHVMSQPLTDPFALTKVLEPMLPGPFSLTGTIDRRLLLAERSAGLDGWTVADLSGQPHSSRTWPGWTRKSLQIHEPGTWLSGAHVRPGTTERLLHPKVLLAALYHPEWFPLPRFPLSISDLTRAARATLLGQVRLMDMQLGVSLDDILGVVGTWGPDVMGVSATFGQHDLMIDLLDQVYARPEPPLMVAGGSLTVRNEGLLLDRYPRLLIARGAGEPTIADVLAHVHGGLDLSEIRGVGYSGAARGGGLSLARHRTPGVANRAQTDFLPELDLLDSVLARHGVAQLEASRGCTNFCSFCPRGHKGTWAGAPPPDLTWILREMGQIFDRHPHVSRTMYLVDEEVIGAGPDAVQRVLQLAEILHAEGFQWESSCRIDQVVSGDEDRAWHLERGEMWRQLVQHGLRRMLFGVESGVTTILERFAKETTAEQNALAIRTLSALGVPTRFTYITFDQLMSLEELEASHAFQARTDLLLRPLPHLSIEQIIDGVRDDGFVAANSAQRPFFSGISYMLVSMECLIGAAYTRKVEAAGLAGQVRPAMGRVDASFADWRIGSLSHHSQLWVDRNFSLDYTLKSLEKILDGAPRHLARAARVVLKDAAFNLFSDMLALARDTPRATGSQSALEAGVQAAMISRLAELADSMAATMDGLLPALSAENGALLLREHDRWAQERQWTLINAATPA